MKLDDASWHFGGDFPKDLNNDHAMTHMGMFFGWMIDHDLISSDLMENAKTFVDQYKRRQITGVDVLKACCDEKLILDDFSEVGAAFAKIYYENDYFGDYAEILGQSTETIYHVENSWENFEKMSAVISQRYQKWLAARG